MCLRNFLWYFLYLCWDEPNTALIGYARCSTDDQDLTAQV